MANPSNSLPLTRPSVIAAHELVKPYIHYTPVLTNSTITRLASTPQSPEALVGTEWEGRKPADPEIRIWLKCENLQKVGAFKARGAFHAIQRLMAEEGWEEAGGRQKGVITHSSGWSPLFLAQISDVNALPQGNHAQALALAARTMNVPVTIVMPAISTPSKIAATQGYGACVLFSGSTAPEREAVVATEIKKRSAVLIPPYDHPDIILGAGTCGLEFQTQVEQMMTSDIKSKGQPQPKCSFTVKTQTNGHGGIEPKRKGLDAIITPCGGGGLLSGTALSCAGTGILVFGAEPSFQGADDCKRGLAAGKRIESVSTLTIADGLRTPVGAYPWSIISNPKMVRTVYNVGEAEIKKALRLVMERMKVVVEPSAVVGLAVALFNEDFRAMVEREAGKEGWDLGVVFSGGNVSLEGLVGMFSPEGDK
jgi:threonine dehydratase